MKAKKYNLEALPELVEAGLKIIEGVKNRKELDSHNMAIEGVPDLDRRANRLFRALKNIEK